MAKNSGKKSEDISSDNRTSVRKGKEMPKSPDKRTCGAMHVHYRLLKESEAYVEARSQIESMTKRSLRQPSVARGTISIPVVVHVVYSNKNQNISEDQIRSQIKVLNLDYSGKNGDISQVPPVWKGLAKDPHIEFFLATKDPKGKPTSGITRKSTRVRSFTDDDKVKSKATGGDDAWPADRYLNLWVCQLGGGLLGYAQFPGGPAATDGVVITHTGFGTMGTATAPFNLGRTATHEIGHWLNLFHIWGDDGTGCTGTDQVDDTPNQGGPNYGTPGFPHVSCENGPNGDMFMNYMDYVDDGAMYMFTSGQIARIDATLKGPRSSFASTV